MHSCDGSLIVTLAVSLLGRLGVGYFEEFKFYKGRPLHCRKHAVIDVFLTNPVEYNSLKVISDTH